MKNKQRFLLIVLMTIAVSVFAQQYDPEDDFRVDQEKNGITIKKYVGSKQKVLIPPTIQGLPVISIGYEAFRYFNNITNVTIPNSVISIEKDAFTYCEKLTSVNVPDSVTSIGEWAFGGCESLASITIPNSVVLIGVRAFESCHSLTNVTIPDSVISIGNEAFADCRNLTSVTFATGSNITYANFGNAAFPEGDEGNGGYNLYYAYNMGKAGTYTRDKGGSTWTKK